MAIQVVRRLGVENILEQAEERLKLYEDRDQWYDRLMTYYYGKNSSGGAYSPSILTANAQGRPMLRQVGESIMTNRTYSSQRLAPVVDDYAAVLGRLPTSRVDPPDSSPQGQSKAELLTKYLYSTYEMSQMESQQAQAGFFQTALGDAVYVLEPEPDELRVVWTTMSPRNAYPRFWHGYRRFEVYDLITIEVWNEDDIETQLGVSPYSESPSDCTVLIYVSPYQRSIVLGTSKRASMVRNVDWDLGFCPAAWVYNKVTGRMGMSDIGQSLSQQDFLDWSFNVWADGLVHMTYPILVIKDPINMGQDQITIGPGAPPVPVLGSGDLKAITTGADPRAIEAIMTQTLSDINTATGTSQVRQEGQMHGSIVTGRATHAVQGPQSTRIEHRQGFMASAWRSLNKMTLLMQQRAPHLSAFEGDIYGNYKGQSFQTQFSAKQDIDGWTRNTVTWESLIGMNIQQKLGVAYEGMVSEIWDDIRAREIVGEDDPIGMRDRVKAMLMHKMEMQAASSGQQGPSGQPQAPSAPSNPSPAQGGAAPNPAGGPGQGAAPPPQIFRPPGLMRQQAPPGDVPKGVTLDSIRKVLERVADKLKGTAYAIGQLALQGQADQATIAVSDSRDYSKVLTALREVDPKAKVRKVPEDKMPLEAVRVA